MKRTYTRLLAWVVFCLGSLALAQDGCRFRPGTTNRDLEALRGSQTFETTIHSRQVTEIVSLAGLPLTNLSLLQTGVSDLSPLRGMELKYINCCGSTNIQNLEPLTGMPLGIAILHHTTVADLAPLAKSPLKRLSITMTPVSDIRPLATCPIEEIRFDPKTVVYGVDVLRAMKTLRQINEMPTEVFWKRYDTGEFMHKAEPPRAAEPSSAGAPEGR